MYLLDRHGGKRTREGDRRGPVLVSGPVLVLTCLQLQYMRPTLSRGYLSESSFHLDIKSLCI
jgi:hypothetical protein